MRVLVMTWYGGSVNADTIYGDAGNDSLHGEYGADSLVGGSGNDVYWVSNPGSRAGGFLG